VNLYFLVEGRTEQKVYPKWLAYLLPEISRVDSPDAVSQNNYFLISGGGFPSLLDNHLINSFEDVNDARKYDFLIICLDSDDDTPTAKIEEVKKFIADHQLQLSCYLHIIVQTKCMETWFMGNRTVYARNPSPKFKLFAQFYNVSVDDPERMTKPQYFQETQSVYHYEYLKNMLAEKNIRYTKNNPKGVVEKYYLEELIKRVKQYPNQLATLAEFLDFFTEIGAK